MRNLLLAAPLLMAALPAAAQTHIWSGPNLMVNGATLNGCNIQVLEVSHTSTTTNPIRVGLLNAGTSSARVYAHLVITGPLGTKVNPEFNISMAPGVGAFSNRAGGPPEGSLANTRMTVNITNCVQR